MLEKIAEALKGIRQHPQDEKDLQSTIARCLTAAGIPFSREVLTSTGPVDFVVGTTAIEIKIRGSATDVARQIIRYLDDERFTEGIIITTRPMLIPIQKSGEKPIRVIDLWRNFL